MPQARIWERDGTLAAIERLLSEVRLGQGRSLFIVGEAGLGKTTMVERAHELAGAHFRIGVGRGEAAESSLPFGTIDQALRALGFRGEAKSRATADDGLNARNRRLYAVLQFLEERPSPTLLMLDDLHWADDDSLSLLNFLGWRIGGIPIAILGTMRPWPPAAVELARRLAKDGNASIDRLRPLSESGAAALLTDRAGRSISSSSARRASGLAAGNPLLLEQVARDIQRGRGVPDVAGDSSEVEVSLLRERFTGVSADDLRYAQAASVLGIRFRPGVAAAIAELSPSDGDRALEALCGGNLVRSEVPGWARFAHPLLRQVLYDEIPGPLRARRHARAFHLLLSAGAGPAEAAEHALRADLVGDSTAVAVLTEAGRDSMRAGAIAGARQRLRAAAQMAGTRASAELLMELGEVLLASGEGDEAAAAFRRLLAKPDLDRGFRSAALRRLGRALFIRGAVQDARKSFEAAVDTAIPGDETQAIEALLDQAFIAWPTGGPALAMPLLERARGMTAHVPPALGIRVDTAWGFTAFIRGDPAGIPVVKGAVEYALANPEADTADFAWSWGTLGTYGNLAKWSERFGDATRAYEIGIKAAERMGLPVAIAAVAVMHADTCIRTGHLRTALELADRATLLSELAPERAFWAAIEHAYILADMGHMEECAQWFGRATALAGREEYWAGRVWLLHIEAVLAMHARRTAEACAHFDRLRSLADRLEIVEPCVIPWAGDAITAYGYAGRLSDALAIIAELESMAERLPCRFPRIVAIAARAAGPQAAGDLAETQRMIDEAIRLAAEIGMPVLEARLRNRLGIFLRKSGQNVAARPYLRAALELAERSGADGLAARAEEELKLAGGQRPRRPQRGPDELTPAEARVCRLAEQGVQSQRIAGQLFLSGNTIETHLQHIYRKLGINSQRELIARAQGRGTGEPPGSEAAERHDK
jgi:DNA-binding CsgD family transcriptional regulator/predicted negative regulator of RcsB-dependent stress response